MAETFRTISNLQRKPSMLSVLDPITEGRLRISGGSLSPSNGNVQSWQQQEVTAWLDDIGMKEYSVREKKSIILAMI